MSDKINKQNRIVGSNKNYTAPEYKKTAFHCSHCNVYANQHWLSICQCDKKLVVEKNEYLFKGTIS